MEIDITLAMAVIASVIGICGWLSGREKTVGDEAKWRGNVDAKLDLILELQKNFGEMEDALKEQENRITIVENSAKAFHRRVDELMRAEAK